MRSDLPIDTILPELLGNLAVRRSAVVHAPPGAGKTTRVPPALLDAGLAGERRIVMLEPRRVAARAAARRIAAERGVKPGGEVGYRIRFDRKEGRETRILVVTEGILVQMLQRDPFLEDVGVVIFDEFHERNLYSDLSLALCRKVQREARDDLKLVVMSATLAVEPIAVWLGDCAVVRSEGRQYPVEVRYQERADPRALPVLVSGAVREVLEETPGDVLVFLPGVGEIRRSGEMLASLEPEVRVMPLYGDLPPEKQDAVLRPGDRRKVVLATNVAETSVTIEGLTAVIDSGLVRRLRFDPGYGLDRLELGRVSRASADQRAGRAGRQGPGLCLRLWTEHDHRSLPEHEVAEILRVDLAGTVLELLAWGEGDPSHFEWFEAPESAAVERALGLLAELRALDSSGRLTELGRLLARLPLHPRLARLLVSGHQAGELRRAALCAALLSERDVVNRPTGHRPVVARHTANSDLLDRVEAVEAQLRSGYGETALGPVHPGRTRHVARVARQLEHLAERRLGPGESLDDGAALRRALFAAYPDRLARRREAGSRRAVQVGGRGIRLAEMSAVREAEFFLCLELDAGARGRSESLVRQASAIDAEWLPEEHLEKREEAIYDPERDRVVGRRQTLYRDLVLTEAEIDPGTEAAEEMLVQVAGEDLAAVLPEDPAFDEMRTRLACLAEWMPELDLPVLDDDRLRNLLPALVPGRRSLSELRRAPWLGIAQGLFDHRTLSSLDELAPTHLQVPSGSRIHLRYEAGKPPVLAVRIQELFGLTQTPAVAGGRMPVLLHLLAPNHRPQQVTDDLASFWRNTYPEVRKELKARYAKHAWPEDPLAAEPESRPRRKR